MQWLAQALWGGGGSGTDEQETAALREAIQEHHRRRRRAEGTGTLDHSKDFDAAAAAAAEHLETLAERAARGADVRLWVPPPALLAALAPRLRELSGKGAADGTPSRSQPSRGAFACRVLPRVEFLLMRGGEVHAALDVLGSLAAVVAVPPAVSAASSLRLLDLSHTPLATGGRGPLRRLAQLLEAPHALPHLQALRLDYTGLDDAGLAALCGALGRRRDAQCAARSAGPPCLRLLSLRAAPLSAEAVAEAAECVLAPRPVPVVALLDLSLVLGLACTDRDAAGSRPASLRGRQRKEECKGGSDRRGAEAEAVLARWLLTPRVALQAGDDETDGRNGVLLGGLTHTRARALLHCLADAHLLRVREGCARAVTAALDGPSAATNTSGDTDGGRGASLRAQLEAASVRGPSSFSSPALIALHGVTCLDLCGADLGDVLAIRLLSTARVFGCGAVANPLAALRSLSLRRTGCTSRTLRHLLRLLSPSASAKEGGGAGDDALEAIRRELSAARDVIRLASAHAGSQGASSVHGKSNTSAPHVGVVSPAGALFPSLRLLDLSMNPLGEDAAAAGSFAATLACLTARHGGRGATALSAARRCEVALEDCELRDRPFIVSFCEHIARVVAGGRGEGRAVSDHAAAAAATPPTAAPTTTTTAYTLRLGGNFLTLPALLSARAAAEYVAEAHYLEGSDSPDGPRSGARGGGGDGPDRLNATRAYGGERFACYVERNHIPSGGGGGEADTAGGAAGEERSIEERTEEVAAVLQGTIWRDPKLPAPGVLSCVHWDALDPRHARFFPPFPHFSSFLSPAAAATARGGGASAATTPRARAVSASDARDPSEVLDRIVRETSRVLNDPSRSVTPQPSPRQAEDVRGDLGTDGGGALSLEEAFKVMSEPL